MNRYLILAGALLLVAIVPLRGTKSDVNLGSKKFTESVILGEILTQSFESAGIDSKHYQELGGTRIAFNALRAGEIDAYPEYTGTIRQELFAGRQIESIEDIRNALRPLGMEISEPLGFNNTYALAMKSGTAERLGVHQVSDLARHPELRFGLTNEFLDRGDGWKALSEHYGFRFSEVRGLDHDIAYRQLDDGIIDVMDVYSTDAKIEALDLQTLEDDRKFFPRYDAVLLFRSDLLERFPGLEPSLDRLAGRISEREMIMMNHRVEISGVSEAGAASEFLRNSLGVGSNFEETTTASEVFRRTIEHLDLVRRSLIPAILIGIPLGVIAHRMRRTGTAILGSVGILQTIPSLALLVLLMPLVGFLGGQSIGTGSLTAVLALFLYSLLPIVRGTYTGLASIESDYVESAEAMGLSSSFRLWNIELPLATRSLLSGIKTAAVMNVGFATLGALIGAGGYGQPILTGIRLASTELILLGAIPAAVLAILTQWGFDLIEKALLNPGMGSRSR